MKLLPVGVKVFALLMILILSTTQVRAEVYIRQTIILTPQEQEALIRFIQQNDSAYQLWLDIRQQADSVLDDAPDPQKRIHYEGLLDTNPKRIRTEQALKDMEKLARLLFAYYGSGDTKYVEKTKQFVMAWVQAYKATGNPINENKFEPLIHCYYVMKSAFTEARQQEIEQWLEMIAEAEMGNHDIPMNNWEAKRIKLVSLIGLILDDEEYLGFANRHFKAYTEVALNGDGTTRDLTERDALGYHTSGLKPLMVYGITLQQSKRGSDLNPFTYQNSEGGSIRKSVDYVNSYARGEKIHKEWVKTTVELDKKRAEAGLEKYQPGTRFKPKDALEMYELAYFYDEDYLQLINTITGNKDKAHHSWFFMLLDEARKS